jgi:hypothetical protein
MLKPEAGMLLPTKVLSLFCEVRKTQANFVVRKSSIVLELFSNMSAVVNSKAQIASISMLANMT